MWGDPDQNVERSRDRGGDRSRLVETTRTGTGDAGSPLGQLGPHVATRKELPWNTAVSGKGRPGSGSSITEREPAPVECAPRILAERGATSHSRFPELLMVDCTHQMNRYVKDTCMILTG